MLNTVQAIRRMSTRRHKALRASCDDVEKAIVERQNGPDKRREDEDADKYFEPLRLACISRTAKITSKALDCMQKLMAYGYLRGRRLVTDRDSDNQPRQRPLISLIVDTICSCRSHADENVQLQVIKALLTAVTCNHCHVHETALLRAVQACYQIHIESKSPVNRSTAKGTLRQMVTFTFERMENHDKREQLKQETAYRASLVRKASEIKGSPKSDSSMAGSKTANDSESEAAPGGGGGGAASAEPGSSSAVVPSAPPPAPTRGAIGIVPPPAVAGDIWSTRKRLWVTSEEFRRQVRGRSGPNMYPHVYMCLQFSTPIHNVTDLDLDEQEDLRRKRRARLGPGSSAALDDPFASVLHRDAFLLFRTLCKLSMKGENGDEASGGGNNDPYSLESKVLALELLLGQLEASGSSFRAGDKFIFAIKNYLCDSLIRNISLVGATRVVNLSLRIFVALITHFKDNLKSEIEVFISSMFLPILEAASAVYEHRMLVLEVFARLCQDSYTVVELFINYDCSDDISNESGVFERIVGAMSKIAHTDCSGDPNSHAVRKARAMRLLALRSLVSLTKCLAEFTDVTGTSQKKGRESQVTSEGDGANDGLDAKSVASDMSEDDQADDNSLSILDSHGTVLVSSVDAFDKKRRTKMQLEAGIKAFNTKPKNGVSFLVYSGLVEPYSEPSRTNEDGTTTDASIGAEVLAAALKVMPVSDRPRLKGDPASLANFLHRFVEGGNVVLDKSQIGDFMGEGADYNVAVLAAYTESMEFSGMEIDNGIRHFLKDFRLPGEAQKVDRMMEKFAQVFCDQNEGVFDSPETAFVLAFSIIMLNTDLHNPNIKEDRKMTKEGFLRNNRGIASGRDLPAEYLGAIFDRIKSNAISLKEDDELRMKKAATARSSRRISAGAVRAKRFALQADIQKDAVNRLTTMRRTHSSIATDAAPGAWLNNMYFTMTDVISSRNADYVRPMFSLLSEPSMKAYKHLLGTVSPVDGDDKIVDLCLQGIRHGIRVAGVFGMPGDCTTYVNALAHYACVGLPVGTRMQRLNLESIKVCLAVALSEGNHLGDGWSQVLEVCSEVARLFIIAETGGRLADSNIFKSPTDESHERMRRLSSSSLPGVGNVRNQVGSPAVESSSRGTPGSGNVKSPASALFGGTMRSNKQAARRAEEERQRRAAVETANAQLVASQIDFQQLERIFTSSTGLGQEAIVDFMGSLCTVAKSELLGRNSSDRESGNQGSGGSQGSATPLSPSPRSDSATSGASATNSVEPRVFSLQKVVEMADYNMHIRPRVVWSKLWQHISQLFEAIGTHPNILIAMYAIDSLKQLGVKFLERTELSHFQFQQVFMQPFERIMTKNPNLEIRELVLSVINNIIQLRHGNIMSGWKVIFSVYSAAAADDSETLNKASFDAMARLIETHWELVHPNFVDIINCFATFAKNVSQETTSQGAISQILSLTGRLVEGNVDVRCDEHGSLLTSTATKSVIDSKMGKTPETKVEGSDEFRFTDSVDHQRVWFPILTSLANLITDKRKSIRQASLSGLFKILSEQGHSFSPSLWELIFKGVLFPIFDDVRHSAEALDSGKFIREWLNNTCQDALNMLVGLFESPKRYSTLSFLLNDVMELVGTCIVHPNKLLARKGVVCMQQLLVDAGRLFPEEVWDLVCGKMVSLHYVSALCPPSC